MVLTTLGFILFGALYNDEEFEDETEHTVQVLIFVISFSFIWITTSGLNK